MERLRIRLEAVTAAFVHVEPEGEARWHAAPFRGLARWWFRAVVGAAKPPAEVRGAEAALFGTTEEPSAVAFRVFADPPGSSPNVDAEINPGSNRRSAKRKALPPGQRAMLEIVPARRGDDPIQDLRRAYAALWVALHFGGLGQRSRRGAGSIRITSVTGPDVAPSPITSLVPATYARELGAGLREVRRVLGVTSLRAIPGGAEFPLLHPACAQVFVAAPSWPAPEESARKALMSVRRQPQFHQTGRREFEFGGINPRRLASPLWARFAALNPAVVVLALFEHQAATRLGAAWGRAKDMTTAIDSDAIRVDLDGGDRA